MEDVARRVGVMMDNEAACAPEGKETEEQNLEDLRRKYPWWLNGRVGNAAAAPAGKADAEDIVILFEGKNTRVWRAKETTSSRVVCQTRTADVVDIIYVNIVTWSMGCVRVGEAAKGGQLIANQGQEWMGTSKKAGSPSK